MKIIKIIFENLNSLLGKHEIDFVKEFGTQGIFAIVGPTGAGKTTILDAICLALYGQTPRLEILSKSENEIMSRQTAECRAEVVFETNNGKQFLCSWTQRRARNRLDGNLQQSNHTISEAGNEKNVWREILKGKDVPKLVEEKTGMSFDNFTRSMLLAQGNFAKFLQSDKDERASILEQITGTDIYTKISIRVHERNRDIQNELKNLKGQLDNVEIFDTETINRIQKEIADLEKDAKEHRRKVDFITKGQQYQKSLEQYKNELQKNKESLQKLNDEDEAFKPDAIKLAVARKTRDIEPIFNDLVRYRNERDNIYREKEASEKKLPAWEQKLDTVQKEKTNAETLYQNATKVRETERETIRTIREIDRELNESDVNLRNVNKRCKELSDEKTKHETSFTELKENLLKTLDGESSDALQTKHNEIKSKLQKLTGGKELSVWRSKRERANEIVRCWNDVLTAFKNRVELRTKKSDCEIKILEIEKELTEIVIVLQQWEREKESKDKIVELTEKRRDDLRTIASLEEHRQQLEDGKPCPCCGAKEHPYAKENLPTRNSVDVELDVAKQEQKKLADKFNDEKSKKSKKENDFEHWKEKQEYLNHQITQEDQKINAAPQVVADEKSIQTAIVTAKMEFEQIGKLITDIETLQKNERELEKRIVSIQETQTKIRLETEWIQQTENNLKIQSTEQTELESIRQRKQNERTALFGDKKSDEYERKLQSDVDSALKILDEKQKSKFEIEKEWNQIKQQLDSVTKTLAEKERFIESTTVEFEKQYRQAGFESETQFTAARIEPNKLNQLEDREKELQTRWKTLTALYNEKNEFHKRIEKELTEHWESESFGVEYLSQNDEKLKFISQTLNDEIGHYNQAIGSRKEKIADNEKREAECQNKKKEIEKTGQEAQLWGTLHELIGSSDGKKYKIFVQSLTFRYLIEYANRQLEKMTDRYLLMPKEEDGSQLMLNIVDKYQSGLERSTKNLSGGESFLVSLALALGLSAMSSQKVRVDSLFLDEGFGTLDEETLETALNVLDGLRQQGKQIGIISHVPLIRERIPLQIRVNPEGGGRSSIKIGVTVHDPLT